MSATTPYTD